MPPVDESMSGMRIEPHWEYVGKDGKKVPQWFQCMVVVLKTNIIVHIKWDEKHLSCYYWWKFDEIKMEKACPWGLEKWFRRMCAFAFGMIKQCDSFIIPSKNSCSCIKNQAHLHSIVQSK